MDFLGRDSNDEVMDEIDFDRQLQDEQIRKIMYRISQCESVAAFQALDRKSVV